MSRFSAVRGAIAYPHKGIPGGLLLSDDVPWNAASPKFCRTHRLRSELAPSAASPSPTDRGLRYL